MYTNLDIIAVQYTNEVYAAPAEKTRHGRKRSYCFRNGDKGIAVRMDRRGKNVIFRIFGNFSKDETLSIKAENLNIETFNIVMHALNDEFEKHLTRRIYTTVCRYLARHRKPIPVMAVCKPKVVLSDR